MSDAPERIWAFLNGPFVGMFVSGGITDGGAEYIRADFHAAEVEALRKENERLRSLVFVGYHEGYTEAGGHWRGNSRWDDSETKFALDNPPPRAALQGEKE